MSILIVLLAVGFLLFLIIMNWRQTDKHRDSDGFYYYPPDDSVHQQHHTSISGQNESQSHSEGHWGGRDMSHDHHDFSYDSDSGGGGDWGGDAGGGMLAAEMGVAVANRNRFEPKPAKRRKSIP